MKTTLILNMQPSNTTPKKDYKTNRSLINSRKIDYLADLRKLRQGNYDASKSIKYNWKADLHNSSLSDLEKFDKVISKANMLEKNARTKEIILNNKGGAEQDPEMGEFISEMFFDAINAKMALLDNLQ